ncbi:MAG: hypothetical protein A2X25_03235 [Chloroflexi bacterium GWB2_49_20]|nr:MAG: hypothetical protein A2X25_03235 [Chloroflexi bacterium GWB2_49_20]OGN76112.1 MAG: hypothetical protein A2X26_11510 [Chloroflexi bacterium GWC2_49_37]OGN83498.1 MAG: hypothetical protein A2X27_09345 [Chloroflexi bacterium GWD2_49_16]
MSEHCHLDFIFSPAPIEAGFGEHQLPQNDHIRWMSVKTFRPFGEKIGLIQRGLVSYMIHNHPDAVIIFANPRYLSYWFVLLAGKFLNIPIYSRGHGLYKKEKISLFYRIMYGSMIQLSKKYLCYTDSVKDSLLPLVKDPNKLAVDYNTLYNNYPVYPQEKTGQEKGIFFIGRLRPRCGIEELIASIQSLREDSLLEIDLHIIGDGILGEWVRKQVKAYPWIFYHGMVYTDREIQTISRNCRCGVFPGDAGLSVVHMMSLSLPPLTHDTMYTHMGPEPSYIQPGVNGWFYGPSSPSKTLSEAISVLIMLTPENMKKFQKNAFDTFQNLSMPPFHERLWALIDY